MFHVKHLYIWRAGRRGALAVAREAQRGRRTGKMRSGATLGGAQRGRLRAQKKRPGRGGRPGRSLRFACSLARVRAYAFTAPYFERFSTSTAAIISTAPTTSAIHGLPVKPAMM